MEFGEILSTVGGGSGIAAVLIVAIPRLLDAVRSYRRDDAKGTELAAELVRERADEHRECREEVAELRHSVAACEVKHARQEVRLAATEAKAEASEARAVALEGVVSELRGVVSWMRRKLEDLEAQHTQEPAE
jgi:signal transduction histidine kinase